MANAFLETLNGSDRTGKALALDWKTFAQIGKVRPARPRQGSIQDHLSRGGRYDRLPPVHRSFAKPSTAVINL
jgi:hypothetical protein